MDPSRGLDYSIVVPVLNEDVALPGLLDELRTLGLLSRTIFVDNGSSDGSPDLIKAAGGEVLLEVRRGYGYPCLAGARAAAARGSRAVVFMEADGTDDPSQLHHLLGPVLAGVADLVIGSRQRAVRVVGGMPWHQRLGNAMISGLVLWLFGLRLPDNGPYRAIRLDLFWSLGIVPSAFAFPIEVVLRTHLAGGRIAFRETAYRPRRGSSKIGGDWRRSVQAGAELLTAIVSLRLSHWQT